jgi:hypothetical protein
MSTYFVSIPETCSFRFDIAMFHERLQERWPGFVAGIGVIGLYEYEWSTVPMLAAPDPEQPGGWYWDLRYQAGSEEERRAWKSPEGFPDWPVRHDILPDLCTLAIDSPDILNCAVPALWLRSWVPSEVPLVASNVYSVVPFTILPGMTIMEVFRGLAWDQELVRRQEAQYEPWPEDLVDPLALMPEDEVDMVVRQMLEDEARADLPSDRRS